MGLRNTSAARSAMMRMQATETTGLEPSSSQAIEPLGAVLAHTKDGPTFLT